MTDKLKQNINPVILADAESINCVLGHLLSNALKFISRKGWVHITISCDSKEFIDADKPVGDGGVLKIEVKDNGRGILQVHAIDLQN